MITRKERGRSRNFLSWHGTRGPWGLRVELWYWVLVHELNLPLPWRPSIHPCTRFPLLHWYSSVYWFGRGWYPWLEGVRPLWVPDHVLDSQSVEGEGSRDDLRTRTPHPLHPRPWPCTLLTYPSPTLSRQVVVDDVKGGMERTSDNPS